MNPNTFCQFTFETGIIQSQVNIETTGKGRHKMRSTRALYRRARRTLESFGYAVETVSHILKNCSDMAELELLCASA